MKLLLLLLIYCRADVFFSRYYMGRTSTSSCINRFVEIFNPTNSDVNLNEYHVTASVNAKDGRVTHDPLSLDRNPRKYVRLDGILPAGDKFVFCRDASDLSIENNCDLADGFLTYNGNDALGLVRGSATCFDLHTQNLCNAEHGCRWFDEDDNDEIDEAICLLDESVFGDLLDVIGDVEEMSSNNDNYDPDLEDTMLVRDSFQEEGNNGAWDPDNWNVLEADITSCDASTDMSHEFVYQTRAPVVAPTVSPSFSTAPTGSPSRTPPSTSPSISPPSQSPSTFHPSTSPEADPAPVGSGNSTAKSGFYEEDWFIALIVVFIVLFCFFAFCCKYFHKLRTQDDEGFIEKAVEDSRHFKKFVQPAIESSKKQVRLSQSKYVSETFDVSLEIDSRGEGETTGTGRRGEMSPRTWKERLSSVDSADMEGRTVKFRQKVSLVDHQDDMLPETPYEGPDVILDDANGEELPVEKSGSPRIGLPASFSGSGSATSSL